MISYPYIILNTAYDIYFSAAALITVVSWYIFKGECLISYFEKKIKDPNYSLGDNSFEHPYYKTFYLYNEKDFSFVKEILSIISVFILIFYRKNNKYVKYALILAIILGFYARFKEFINKLIKLQ